MISGFRIIEKDKPLSLFLLCLCACVSMACFCVHAYACVQRPEEDVDHLVLLFSAVFL